jgi:hypothetical protein
MKLLSDDARKAATAPISALAQCFFASSVAVGPLSPAFTRRPERQVFHYLPSFSRLRTAWDMRYDRIVRADKRDLMRCEEVRA